MKNIKKLLKIVAVISVLSLMVLGLAACGSDAKSEYSLISKGKLVMGTNAAFPPFEYEEGSEVVGVDASIMAVVAEELGVELEIKNMEFDSLPEALTGKQIDVIAAGYTVKPDREDKMDFTDSYYTAKQTIIVKADSTFTSKDNLTDKKIGVQSGTTGSFCAEELTDASNVVGYTNGSLAVEALLSGSVDAVIIDNNPANEYKTQHGDKVKLIEDQFDEEQYAIGVSKGNKALVDAINDVLAKMKDDGRLQEIFDQFIK